MAPTGEEPWYQTPYPYLLVVVAIFALLYYFGTRNPIVMLAFLGSIGLYAFAVHIWVTVIAFKASVGRGFLSLCVPFYALRFVYAESESAWLKSFYSLAFAIIIALRILRKIHYSPIE